MANSNNICTRFINYAAVLILLFFSSLSSAYTGGGGDFSGGGASGSWDEPPKECSIYGRGGFSSVSEACNAVESILNNGWKSISITGNTCKLMFQRQTGDPVYAESTVYCEEQQCKDGYEKDANGKCQPKKCPVGQTLVNGQCKQKQCPAGQALDTNGQCFAPDDQCPSGQIMVNGRCTTSPPDQPDPDPNSEWPPFCEWASVMCQWHKEWQQWSNDYAANEEKANLDREELKRIGLDSKENLDDINQKMTEQKIKLDEIKNQDQQFYDELRLWLNNFDSNNGNPSEQNPSIEFPPFCDWSVQVCNWYLDWKDWRADYNAHNEAVIQKFNAHLEKLNEIKQQDKDYYEQDLQQNNDFYDDARDFFDWYKGQSTENPTDPTDPNDPNNPENQDGNVPVNQEQIPFDESQRITFVNGCPPDQQFTINFMGQSQNAAFSYQPLCQFMSMIRPFVIAIAYLIGAYILMGLSRGSSE